MGGCGQRSVRASKFGKVEHCAEKALADSVQGLSGRSAEQRSRESAQYGVLFQKRSFKETNNKRATGMTNRPKVGLSFF